MASRSVRIRLAVIIVVALASIAALVWWQTRDASPSKAATAGSAEAARGGEPTRTGPRRSFDDSFGAQFKGGAPVKLDGRVIDETGAGVANVDVIFAATADTSVTSGSDGRFSIVLEPGSYEVRATGERLYAAPKPLRVGKVTEPVQLTVEVVHLARLTGWVVDGDGKPVRDAIVASHAPRAVQTALERDGASASTTTAADGRFEIDGFPGAIELTADHPTVGHGRAALKDIPPGSLEEDIEIRLEAYGVLAGVVESPDGNALAGVEVTATIRSSELRQSVTAVSGPGGHFTLEGLMPGTAVLDAKLEGYAPADPMRLAVRATVRRDDLVLALNVARTLTGRVVDADGEPVANAKVKAKRVRSDVPFRSGKTSSDGTFEIEGLDGGPHTITVSVGGTNVTTLELAAIPDDPIELVLVTPTALRGVVTDASGKPVREFTVTVEQFVPAGATRPGAAPAPARYASDDGRYEQPVSPGTYDLWITSDTQGSARKAGVVVEAGAAADGSVQLAPP